MATSLDEPIHFSEYDPNWPTLFGAEVRRLASGLPVDFTFEHIGSTSVPGLLAKPIIDIMLGTEASRDFDAVRPALVDLGYEDLGEAGVPGRIYLRRRVGAAFNIALVQRGGPLWVANLALRDHLRKSDSARREYAEAKLYAWQSGIRSLLAYSDHKASVLSRLLDHALRSYVP